MLDDMSIYEDTKRNEKCPCGSGIIFKKCCMKEYREVKRRMQNAKLSSFSPLVPLSSYEQKEFTEFYIKLMIFSHQQRHGSETIIVEDEKQNMQSFIQDERSFFYENSNEIISKYIKVKNPNKNELIILDALQKARYEKFFLLSKSDDFAVIMDIKENFYNIQALNSPFTEIFTQKIKYMVLQTVLIPYKDRFITDGAYQGFKVDKELESYFNKIPFKNPMINYSEKNDVSGVNFAINFSIGCDDIDKFKDMEEVLLKQIPKDFTKRVVKLFENKYSYKISIFSPFLRSTDFLKMLESENGQQTTSYIFGGCPVTNFERKNDEEFISYDILKHYYKQPLIEQSVSYDYYKDVKKSGDKRAFSTFYTLLGVAQLRQEDHEKFIDFLQVFKTKEKRKELMLGVENLFDDIGEGLNTTIYPVFLDTCVNLLDIGEEINLYYDYMSNLMIPSVKNAQKYSISKGKE